MRSYIIVCLSVILFGVASGQGSTLTRPYTVSFNIDMVGCGLATDQSLNAVTFEINSGFYRQIYTYHEIKVQPTQHLSFQFLGSNLPNGILDRFGVQFRWFLSQSYSHANGDCCWSVYNVTFNNPYVGVNDLMNVRICYEQVSYAYVDRTWVCPDNRESQIETVGLHLEPTGLYVNPRIFLQCMDAMEVSQIIYEFNKWNNCSQNATILDAPLLNRISNEILSSPIDGLNSLSAVTNQSTLEQSLYLLDLAANQPTVDVSQQAFKEVYLNVTRQIFEQKFNTELNAKCDLLEYLQILDKLALKYVEPNGELLTNEAFSLRVQVVNGSLNMNVTGIRIEDNFITLPSEIFTEPKVRVASFFFPNLSYLLPPNDNDSSIISPIISATIDCDSCPVTDLTENVTVQLEIQIENPDKLLNLNCVFLDFQSGDWNKSGCTLVSVHGDLVTCSCNHLTHFAILLSPRGPDIDPTDRKVLNTIGLVLVPISLLCMVLVILTYTLIRSLWSIRNYIHIMLCASLFMAQLVFIIGVDKIENQGACSAVAVILLYLFLVTFMWMLMEGVVLYVTLVRVFITNHIYYIIAFTVASYAAPAVYMILIIPLGYAANVDNIPDKTHFLYYYEEQLTACWLNYSTGFVWSFITPVVIIIMVNIGFFIMAIFVMRKHAKKEQKDKLVAFKYWLFATISLTVVMGIAWLVGLLAFTAELLAIIYIITIFIAAQGILIFIILVPLSKQVRDAYCNVWRKQQSKYPVLAKLSDYATIRHSSKMSSSESAGKTDSGKRRANGHTTVGGITLGTFDQSTEKGKGDSLTESSKKTDIARVD